jgi:hypothetical protein
MDRGHAARSARRVVYNGGVMLIPMLLLPALIALGSVAAYSALIRAPSRASVWSILGVAGGAAVVHLLVAVPAGFVIEWLDRWLNPYDDLAGYLAVAGTLALAIFTMPVVALLTVCVREMIRTYRRNQAIRSGRCGDCGYDVFGLPSPRCPECGWDIPADVADT